MTLRPPRFSQRVFDTPQTALDYEIAQEKASTLGRMGRRLEEKLAALAAFDAAHGQLDVGATRGDRFTLVAEAGVALWHFIVQREALGLRDSARVLRDYNVPKEVHDRMGAFPAKS